MESNPRLYEKAVGLARFPQDCKACIYIVKIKSNKRFRKSGMDVVKTYRTKHTFIIIQSETLVPVKFVLCCYNL